MGTALEEQVKGFLMNEVKLDELRKSIKDAADSINEIKGKEFPGIDKRLLMKRSMSWRMPFYV